MNASIGTPIDCGSISTPTVGNRCHMSNGNLNTELFAMLSLVLVEKNYDFSLIAASSHLSWEVCRQLLLFYVTHLLYHTTNM